MAENLLAPVQIWDDFKIDDIAPMEVVLSGKTDDLDYKVGYIYGRSIGNDRVKIAIECYSIDFNAKKPAIMMIKDFDGVDYNFVKLLAKEGYHVYLVDIAGKDNNENYTVYPDLIYYANYKKDNPLINKFDDFLSSPWYEWTAVVKYAIKYLEKTENNNGLAVIGIGDSATVLWQALYEDKNIKLAVFLLNSGWMSYRGLGKYADSIESDFDTDSLRFISGVEPQSYAKHVLCPTLMIPSLYNYTFDADRAYDTLIRISNSNKALNFTIGLRYGINYSSYLSLKYILDGFLKHDDFKMPTIPTLDVVIENKKLIAKVTCEDSNIKYCKFFYSEDNYISYLRTFERKCKVELGKDKTASCELLVSRAEGFIFALVKVVYDNGIELSTNIVCKKYKAGEVDFVPRSQVFFSTRNLGQKRIFLPLDDNKKNIIVCEKEDNKVVSIKEGPLDIKGLYAQGGLLTFIPCSYKYKINDDSIITFDFYAKANGTLKCSLITDFYGTPTKYSSIMNIDGGEYWHKISLSLKDFKIEQMIPLRSFKDIQAMEISFDGEYLINNLLYI